MWLGMDTYEEIALEAALELPAKDFQQASHVLLYAELPGALFGKYHFKYAVMVSCGYRLNTTVTFLNRCRSDLMGHWVSQGVWLMRERPLKKL